MPSIGDEDTTTWVTHYKLIVNDKVEVSESDEEVSIDSTSAIINTGKNESLVTEINLGNNKTADIKVSEDSFKEASQRGVSLVYDVKNADNKLSYSWTFNSPKADLATEVNLALETKAIDENLKETFDENDAYIVDFAFHGVSPGDAKVKIYVGDKYSAGDKLDLYYNNVDEEKSEEISKDLAVDSEGYVTITISHCSQYVLPKVKVAETVKEETANVSKDTKKTNNPPTGDNTLFDIILLGMGIAGLSMTVLYSKKEKIINN